MSIDRFVENALADARACDKRVDELVKAGHRRTSKVVKAEIAKRDYILGKVRKAQARGITPNPSGPRQATKKKKPGR